MHVTDPILEAEKIVKGVNENVSRYAEPVHRRYPLLFSFLTVFGAAAILHGFEMIVNRIQFFQAHPSYLIIIGAATLLFTGMLYKALGKS